MGKYIRYLCNAFVFYDIERYDIRGKKYLGSSEKFHLCDTGIQYAVPGSRNKNEWCTIQSLGIIGNSAD